MTQATEQILVERQTHGESRHMTRDRHVETDRHMKRDRQTHKKRRKTERQRQTHGMWHTWRETDTWRKTDKRRQTDTWRDKVPKSRSSNWKTHSPKTLGNKLNLFVFNHCSCFLYNLTWWIVWWSSQKRISQYLLPRFKQCFIPNVLVLCNDWLIKISIITDNYNHTPI